MAWGSPSIEAKVIRFNKQQPQDVSGDYREKRWFLSPGALLSQLDIYMELPQSLSEHKGYTARKQKETGPWPLPVRLWI